VIEATRLKPGRDAAALAQRQMSRLEQSTRPTKNAGIKPAFGCKAESAIS